MTETDYKELAELLFKGEDLKTPEEYEALYPYRKLGNKAEVTRLAPSPTGYIHLGTYTVHLQTKELPIQRMVYSS